MKRKNTNRKPKAQRLLRSSDLLDPFPLPKKSKGGWVAVRLDYLKAMKREWNVAFLQRNTEYERFVKETAITNRLTGEVRIYTDTLAMIAKICSKVIDGTTKHKDPISDILCECNRADRLVKEAAQGSNAGTQPPPG